MPVTLSLVFLVLGLAVTVKTQGLEIDVHYPQAVSKNYCEVILTCVDIFGEELDTDDAVFRLNDSSIDEMIDGVVRTGKNQIRFTFNQSQEGVFSCVYNGNEASVSLAASPPASALDGEDDIRYFILPTPDSTETIDLSCSIRPGALSQRYSVQWIKTNSMGTVFIYNGMYDIVGVEEVTGEHPVTNYTCDVIIEHDGPGNIPLQRYLSPATIVNTRVLSTLPEDAVKVEPQKVELGEPTSITCDTIRRGTDFNIALIIRNESGSVIRSCSDDTDNTDKINCFKNITQTMRGNETMYNTASVLKISDTTLLGIGNYTVDCILQQIIGYEYRNDVSYRDNFGRDVIRNSTLTVDGDPGSFSSPPSSPPSSSTNKVILAITVLLVVLSVITALIVAFLVLWRIMRCQHEAPTNRFSSQDRELPDIPKHNLQLCYINQLKEELGQKNMLYLKHHLQLTKVIGEGESGLVYRGYIHGNECVAVKTGKALISENQKENLLKEVSLMMSFEHPNVMPLVGMCFDGEVPLLIMPFMSDGSVLDYVRNNEEMLRCTRTSTQSQILGARKKCMDMCHQIAKGMSYLAMKRFVHRDLAARNCMIDGFAGGVIKVADFGMAEDMYGTNYCSYDSKGRGERVPLKWMAPESIEKNFFSESSDVWSYGVTCWEVFTCGRIPYSGVPVMTLLSELHSGQRLDRPTNIACSDCMWDLIKTCWSFDPEERPTFNDIVRGTADLLDCDSSYIML